MNPHSRSGTIAALLCILAFYCVHDVAVAADDTNRKSSGEASEELLQKARTMINKGGLTFIENNGQIRDGEGQLRPDVAFYAAAGNVRLYFRNNGLSYVFTNLNLADASRETPTEQAAVYRMDLDFLGAKQTAFVEGRQAATQSYNFYTGEGGGVQARGFRQILYHDVYPNIDVAFYTNGTSLKYDFIVHPGGNPADIRMQYTGAESLSITAAGNLYIGNPLGAVEEAIPLVYQQDAEARRPVTGAYHIENGIVSFRLGDFDPAKTLVIDPTVTWATYFGGTANPDEDDYATSIEVDANGDLYICGWTESNFLPATCCWGNHQITKAGGRDAFLAKFTAAGTWVWSTYYGGSGNDEAHDIAVNSYGNCFITGSTGSANLFARVNSYSGGLDAFTSYYAPDGQIIRTQYHGGSGNESGEDIALNAYGNVLVTGYTNSTNLPVSVGAAQMYLGSTTATIPGHYDAFVLSYNPSITAFVWSTYWGSSDNDYGKGIIVDNANAVYICGYTDGPGFPVRPPQSWTSFGGYEAFLAKFAIGGGNTWSFPYGGSGNDYAMDLDFAGDAYGGTGVVYAAGYSDGPNMQVPLSLNANAGSGTHDIIVFHVSSANGSPIMGVYHGGPNQDYAYDIQVKDGVKPEPYIVGENNGGSYPTMHPEQLSSGGLRDAVLARWDNAYNLVYSSYYGGSYDDIGESLVLAANGRIVFTGATMSDGLATGGAYQASHNDGSNPVYYDAFITTLDTRSRFATFHGGTRDDYAEDLVTDNAGNVIVVGRTTSSDFPVQAGYDLNYAGNQDAFLIKYDGNGNLLHGSYFGNSKEDAATAVDVDAYGNIYMAGYTVSEVTSDFPTTGGAFQTTGYNLSPAAGKADAFVAKWDASCNLVWCTLLFGQEDDRANGVALLSNGKVAVTGSTRSGNFPVSSGAHAGNYDAFVTVLNANGASLAWSKYFGGSDADYGNDIAVDSQNEIVITGLTYSSTTAGFSTVGCSQLSTGCTYSGAGDAYVAKFNSGGTLLWSNYYGGSQFDAGITVTIDRSRNIIIGGDTYSDNLLKNPSGLALQGAKSGVPATGNADGFVSKYTRNGTHTWDTYWGTQFNDHVDDIVTEYDSRDVFIVGHTFADYGANFIDELDEPGGYTRNPIDAYVAHISSNGANLVGGTHFGAAGDDYGTGIDIDVLPDGSTSVVFCGHTEDVAHDITHIVDASPYAWQAAHAGGIDAFIAKVSLDGSQLAKGAQSRPEPVETGTEAALRVSLYPNPARGFSALHINSAAAGTARLSLVDLRGAVILEREVALAAGRTVENLDLGGLGAGVYYLRVQGAGSSAVLPLVVQE